MDDFFCYLTDAFGVDSPFSLDEVKFRDYSRPWICKQLRLLCDDSKVSRYSRGIYFIPSETVLGKSVLNPRKVLEKKYLGEKKDVKGFFCGLALLNQMGLSSQMPNVLEIMTNVEDSRCRKINVGNQKVVLKKTRVPVNRNNIAVLQLLEVMSEREKEYYTEERRSILKRFISENRISRKDIGSYLKYYPARTAKNLLESEVVYAAR